jgi:hypothetical protein
MTNSIEIPQIKRMLIGARSCRTMQKMIEYAQDSTHYETNAEIKMTRKISQAS